MTLPAAATHLASSLAPEPALGPLVLDPARFTEKHDYFLPLAPLVIVTLPSGAALAGSQRVTSYRP